MPLTVFQLLLRSQNLGISVQDPGTDLDALGFPMQPPLLDIKMTTSVMEAEVSTIHPDLVIKPPPCIRYACICLYGALMQPQDIDIHFAAPQQTHAATSARTVCAHVHQRAYQQQAMVCRFLAP